MPPRGAPLGHPWGHSSYHAGRAHSRRFPIEWSPQSLVKPSYAEDQACGQIYFYILAMFDPRQSHVCKVTFGTGRIFFDPSRSFSLKNRHVTDLNVADLELSGPRIPFCATRALWGRVTSFFDHFSKHLSSVSGRTELCHEVRNPGPPKPQIICNENHHLALFDSHRAKIVKKVFRHFLTIFARHQVSGPFWVALNLGVTCFRSNEHGAIFGWA